MFIPICFISFCRIVLITTRTVYAVDVPLVFVEDCPKRNELVGIIGTLEAKENSISYIFGSCYRPFITSFCIGTGMVCSKRNLVDTISSCQRHCCNRFFVFEVKRIFVTCSGACVPVCIAAAVRPGNPDAFD